MLFILFPQIEQAIPDENLCRLIRLCIQMGGVNRKLKWTDRNIGLPQGAVLSPLLSNLYLNEFDALMLAAFPAYIRYADDFVILCREERETHEAVSVTVAFLKEKLQLGINRPLVESAEAGLQFLGIHIRKHLLSLTAEKEEILCNRIRQIEWAKDKLSEKYLLSNKGIKQYYGSLLPASYAYTFDKAFIDGLTEYCKSHPVPLKQIRSVIQSYEFFSPENLSNRQAIYTQIASSFARPTEKKTESTNKKLIRARKTEYRRRESENSELVISSYGYFIGAGSNGLSIKKSGSRTALPYAANIKHIVVMSDGVSFSSNAVKFCIAHDIPIDFFDSRLNYIASVLSPKYIQTTLWGLQAAMTAFRRIELARKIILGKLKNQLNLIKYFHKYHHSVTSFAERYQEIVRELDSLIKKVKDFAPADSGHYQKELMAFESGGALLYWDYIRLLIADDNVGFEKRNKQGASDLVNSMLNYGYSLLYPRIWQNLIRVRLNPYDGVIHYQSGNPNLVFDVIELFRCQAVDRVVISLVQKGEPLNMKDGLLDDATKNLLVSKIVERLNRYERYRSKEMHFYEILHEQAKEIAAFIAGGQTYRPYIAKW